MHMARSEAQRAADRRYNAKVADRYKLVSAKVKAEEAEAFRLRCKENGTTVNAVLRSAIRNYMEEDTAHD